MKKNIFPILIFTLFFVSCVNNSIKEKTITKIDSILTKLDSAKILLAEAKNDSITIQMKRELDLKSKQLLVKLDTLALDKKTFTKISAYINLHKFFKKLNNKIGEVEINLQYTINQLNDLKYDVPVLVEKDTAKLNKYLTDEEKAAKIVVNKVKSLYNSLQEAKTKYDLLNPLADSLLNN